MGEQVNHSALAIVQYCNISCRCTVKRDVIVLALLLIVQLVSSVSGFAQADTEPRRQPSFVTAMRAYVPVRDERSDIALPSNLIVAEQYREVVEVMRESSPTFRQQCLRIANDPWLTVVLQSEVPELATRARALTRIRREPDGHVRAVVRIGNAEQAAELIAHEFEHIIEQLDGIDLRSKAELQGTGVSRCRCGDTNAYETLRAVSVGLQVARDVQQRPR